MKVLYVCPFAHYPGHYTWAAGREIKALASSGADILLLTPWGLIDETRIKVPHQIMYSHTGLLYRLASFCRRRLLSRWFVMFFETLATLNRAVWLKRKYGYDVIHLRDGEPFTFLPHLLSLPFKGYRWAIWMTASNIYLPTSKSYQVRIYKAILRLVNSNLWRPIYHTSLKRNRFVYMTENDTARHDYESYMNGVFAGKVVFIPLGASNTDMKISKAEAREHLGLPLDKPIMLSFGAPHSGKNVDVIFQALKYLDGTYLVHAGTQVFGLGANLMDLARDYVDPDRVIVRDCYIPEEEKPYYFFASDAMILSYKRYFSSSSSLLWEACHYELPVISSNNVQLGKLVKDYHLGVLFEAENPDMLQFAVRRFISLPPERIQTIKANCRRFASEYSIDKWTQNCIGVYHNLMEIG